MERRRREPDFNFDEFWRQMQGPPLRRAIRIISMVAGALLIAWLAFSSYYTVEADEVGVIQRFGKYIDPPAQPGLHWKIPFGIDTVQTVKVNRVETLAFGFRSQGIDSTGRTISKQVPQESLMLTGDQNVVSVEWIVQYKIKDPANYLFEVKDPVETIRDVSEAITRLVVGDSSATEVLTARRKEIAGEVKEQLQKVLDDYRSGIDIQTVELQDVIPPTKAVQDSFNEVNRARQEKETTINGANRAYLKAIPEAEGEARKVIQEAEGYKLKRVNEAIGDAAKFEKLLAEYKVSKDVTRRRLYLEAIEDVLPNLTRIYVIDEDGQSPLQVLDLEETLGGARRAKPPAAGKEVGR